MIKIHEYFLMFIFLCTISLIYAQYMNPIPRFAHTSSLIGSKLYFIGGAVGNISDLSSDFFYLNLSIPFSTDTLPFVSVNNNGLTPNAFCTIATISDTIYLIGGYMIDQSSLV